MAYFNGSTANMTQVVQRFLPAYRQHYKLSPEQASVCQSIVQCQTEALGGKQQQCMVCGYEQRLYHSCGNRHCPRCKQQASEQWEEKQSAALLPVRYYHLVFTMPHELNAWCQLHPKTMYAMLFKAAWQTLSQFSRTHKRLRGQLGVTCILHTWGQNLQRHVHMHCLIPGLALKARHNKVETTQSDYLYPINALKKVFRGKMVSLLRSAWQQGELFRITHVNEVSQVLDTVMSKNWSVYIKPYLKKPETVVKYLSRYTYRIAISNQRIVKIDQDCVYFRWKDYADNSRKKVMKLDGVEFLRRFLMHVLPSGFMRIRHFGFLANCVRKVRLEQLRQLLIKTGTLIKRSLLVKSPEPGRTCLCPSCRQGSMKSVYRITSFKERRRKWRLDNAQISV